MTIHRVPTAGAVGEGYPHGHLGHLTPEEEKAFSDFKVFIEEKGLYKPGPPASHTDSTLLRFLRARKWVVQDAYQQFSDTEAFRKANQIEVLYDTIDIDKYEETRKLYPRYTGRRDKRGIPLYVFQIRHLDSAAVAAYERSTETTYSRAQTDGKTPAKLLRLIALYENLTRFVQPLTTECPDRPYYPHTPITLSTNIVDISHVSLRMFWNLKNHMQIASELASSKYPETLDRIFIIGAPAFFGTVWGWVKRWFDPVTVSKIFILSPHEIIPVLTQFMDIKDIPKAYGGQLEWSYFEDPAWDDEIMRICKFENGHKTFPHGPMWWQPVEGSGGKQVECVAYGTKNGKDRKERVCTITRDIPPEPAADPVSVPNAEVVEGSAPAPSVNEPLAEKLAELSVAREGAKQNGTAVATE